MIIPPYLQKGDRVALVATARFVTRNEIAPAVKTLKSWGLIPVLGKNLFRKHHQFAGTDAQRASDLQKAIDDKNMKAVFCARGGYGTVRIIDNINFKTLQKSPKWIVGFSDITVLHSHLNNLGIASIHGPMPLTFVKSDEANNSLMNALFGKKISYSYKIEASAKKHIKTGRTEGQLVGGNLSILQALSGSASDIDTKGKLLFIEDLDEYLYHMDRMMHQLSRSGKLANLKGLIVGGMSDMKDNTTPFGSNTDQIISELTKEKKYPLAIGFPAGHITKNLALKLGCRAKLTVSKSNILFEQD